MLARTVELLGGLFSEGVLLLLGFSIVGSIVAALLAVSRGSATPAPTTPGNMPIPDVVPPDHG
jgi:hypothetical protein